MEAVCGQNFEGLHVEIDGKHFIDCTLRDCVLEYGGGVVILERTSVIGCQHVFCGPARCTISYLETMGLIPPPPAGWTQSSGHIH